MGRFIGLSKNRGSGLAIEDPDFLNSGLILTSNGTGFVLACLLYTSDAADDTPCVDLGGRRIIKKKK